MINDKDMARIEGIARLWGEVQFEIARLQALLSFVSDEKRKSYQGVLERQKDVPNPCDPQNLQFLLNEEWCTSWITLTQDYQKLLQTASTRILEFFGL